MYDGCMNIYKNARQTAGLTQERFAELLGISVEAVRQYESGKITPSDDVVLRMAEVAGQHIICYWHLLNKSRVAARILPDLEQQSLAEAVLSLLVQVEAFRRDGLEELTHIAADGKISPEETGRYALALAQLRDLVSAALGLEYAKQKDE